MQKKHLVFLPGLDGTGSLFAPLIAELPQNYSASIVSYPAHQELDYAQLLLELEQQIPTDCDFTLVAESFSGPLAVFYAANNPGRLKNLILCASFVVSPVYLIPDILPTLIGTQIFSLRPPDWALRYWLLGSNNSKEILAITRSAIQQVSPKVLAHRVGLILNVDARQALRKCQQPMLYIRATKDALIQEQSWQVIKAQRPETKYCEVEGPHLLLQTKPKEAIDLINEFLESQKTS